MYQLCPESKVWSCGLLFAKECKHIEPESRTRAVKQEGGEPVQEYIDKLANTCYLHTCLLDLMGLFSKKILRPLLIMIVGKEERIIYPPMWYSIVRSSSFRHYFASLSSCRHWAGALTSHIPAPASENQGKE